MKNHFLLSAAVALAASLVSCSPESRAPQGGAGAGEDIPVGVYAALTGPTATFGQATRDGATLAAEEINAAGGVLGKKFRLIVEDDQGKPEEAASVVTKLITSERVVALIGENASSRSLAAAPIAQANRVPMISPSSTNPDVTKKGDYIFRVCFIDPYQAQALARFVRNSLKADRVAILRDVKNDYSVGLANFFTETFKASGGTIVADQSYSEGDADFRAQLTAIRQVQPQVIFIPGYYTDAGAIAIQARDLGLSVPLVGGDGWDSPKLIEIGGAAIEGSFYANHYSADEQRPAVQKFVAKFREKHGREPDAVNVLAYDAMYLLADAIKRAGSTDGKAIRDQLAASKEFPAVSGAITFDADRNPLKPVAILEVKGGKLAFREWVRPE